MILTREVIEVAPNIYRPGKLTVVVQPRPYSPEEVLELMKALYHPNTEDVDYIIGPEPQSTIKIKTIANR